MCFAAEDNFPSSVSHLRRTGLLDEALHSLPMYCRIFLQRFAGHVLVVLSYPWAENETRFPSEMSECLEKSLRNIYFLLIWNELREVTIGHTVIEGWVAWYSLLVFSAAVMLCHNNLSPQTTCSHGSLLLHAGHNMHLPDQSTPLYAPHWSHTGLPGVNGGLTMCRTFSRDQF